MAMTEPVTETTLLQSDDLQRLLEADPPPCVSIYLPTSRFPHEAAQNRIGFKNGIDQVHQALQEQMRPQQLEQFLHPLKLLEGNEPFWADQGEGLALFYSQQRLWLRKLLQPVPERTVVADSFHVRPLIRIAQSMQRYRLLCVSMDKVALYEGHESRLMPVPLHSDVPTNLAEAIGEPDHITRDRKSRYDFTDNDQRDDQLRRYFRRVDQAIWDHHSRQVRLPMILATLASHQSHFREVSHNPDLIEAGLDRDPFHNLDLRELGELAWQTFDPEYRSRLHQLREHYGTAQAHGHATTDIQQMGPQATYGQIDTLMLADDFHLGGQVDRETGRVILMDINEPNADDVLDDLAELVLSREGRVLVLPRDWMPDRIGACATLRYTMQSG